MINVKLLKDMTSMKKFPADSVIVRENESGDEMYILLKGTVGVYKNYRGGNELLINTLEPGSFFGEMTLFIRKNRTATIVAMEDVVVLAINRTNTYRFFSNEQDAANSMIQTLCRRIVEGNLACDSFCKQALESSVLYTDNFFSGVQKNYTYAISRPNESYIKTVPAQSEIVRAGDELDGIYIILKGDVGIYRDGKLIAELKPGNFFGYMNFPDGCSCVDIKASESTMLLALTKANISRVIECEPRTTYVVIQILCERIDLLNRTYERLNSSRYESSGFKGHIIFPDDHKVYELDIDTPQDYLVDKFYSCPVCKKSFKGKAVDLANIASYRMDDDYRRYYKNIEPIFHDVVNCPNCWYSALREHFNEGLATEYLFNKTIQPYKDSLGLMFEKTPDVNSLFMRYYLALLCAESCFISSRNVITGKLWLRLYWLYRDCEDPDMAGYAMKKAYESFMEAYSMSELDGRQSQPLLILAGVLAHKMGDEQSARRFLSEAKLTLHGQDKHKERAQELMDKYELFRNYK